MATSIEEKVQDKGSIKFFQRYDMIGISKKNCSDVVNSANNQSILVATSKMLYKLQFADGKYNLTHVKLTAKNEDEFHLFETCKTNSGETYIYACVILEVSKKYEIMVFRNDFKDLVDTKDLEFQPITIRHIVYNESIYTVLCGEAMTACKNYSFSLKINYPSFPVYVLTTQKDKKLSLVQIFDMPMPINASDGAVCIDYYISKKQIFHLVFGFFDGTIRMYELPIDSEDKTNEKNPKFFTKPQISQDETTLQLPITRVHLAHLSVENKEDEALGLVASSSLGYLIYFENVIKNRFKDVLVLPLKNENKLDTIMDCVLYDIDDDGEKEIIAVTYLADLFVIKKEMDELKIVASTEIDACFYHIYIERHGERKFIILCGDNEIKIFEYTSSSRKLS